MAAKNVSSITFDDDNIVKVIKEGIKTKKNGMIDNEKA